MDIEIFQHANSVDGLVAAARQIADDGFARMWSPQIFGLDTLTALAVVGREVPGLAVGTSVVPTYPRHPITLAQQALTANEALDGRLTLGIGLSHQPVIEGMFGLSFDKPLRHMREYLAVLLPLLGERKVSFGGEAVTGRGQLDLHGPTCPVLIAALGPKMLELAGRETDGTILWMTGPRTIESHIAPTIRDAAESAGRPAPGIVAGFPVCVTGAVEAARERAANEFAIYGQLTSYRAMLDREGVDGPGDLAIVGDEDTVAARIEDVAASGATVFAASEFGSADERAATRALLKRLNNPT